MMRAISILAFVFVALTTSYAFGGSVFTPEQHGMCFPASKWSDESDGDRPCAQITRVYEDGSFKFAVRDADGQVTRYSGGVGAYDR